MLAGPIKSCSHTIWCWNTIFLVIFVRRRSLLTDAFYFSMNGATTSSPKGDKMKAALDLLGKGYLSQWY
jgi:hypothetical protein